MRSRPAAPADAGFAAELEGAVEGGVAHAGQHGHAAALGGQVDEPDALVRYRG